MDHQEMEARNEFCWFNKLSDDILLKIFVHVARSSWKNLCQVCQRFRNVCHDKEIFRVSNLEGSYGLPEHDLLKYLRAGSKYIETLNLNHCYWLRSSQLASGISRCKKIHHLYLIDCNITSKALSKIVCAIERLKTLVISVGNLLVFSNEINGNTDLQASLRHLEHFTIHICEEASVNSSLMRFRLSQETSVLEYSPNLQTFNVIGIPGMVQRLSEQLIHPLIVTPDNLLNLKSMGINLTNDATSRLYFFGILVKSFDQPGIHFKNLSIPGLDLDQAVKRSYIVRALKESYPSLESLDLSRVNIDTMETSFIIEDAPCLKHLCLGDIRSEERCVELMKSASHCKNLVSLNLKGATSRQKNWQQEELQGLHSVLENCKHLRHLNLAGVHVHCEGTSLVQVLTSHSISEMKSLALSTCCIINPVRDKQSDYVSKGLGKRQRVSRLGQQTSSSTDSDDESLTKKTDLYLLSRACPGLKDLELIETGFTHSVIYSNVSYRYTSFQECEKTRDFIEPHLSAVGHWKNLRYLQITGMPFLASAGPLQQIAKGCGHLEHLFLAYLGSGSNMKVFWDSLLHFQHLKDLRIEQNSLRLDDQIFESCLKCSKLERLVIISSSSATVDHRAVKKYIHAAKSLYVFQLITDMYIKDCRSLSMEIRKRMEKERPGFHIMVENLERVIGSNILGTLPLVHMSEVTDLTSRVASRPLNALIRDLHI